MGAAGRDFHDFNTVFRDDPAARVVAFTAAQIPGIERRRYPPELAGPNYPEGIPILPESELEAICRREGVDEVVFAYSDVPHEAVMHAASRMLAIGADFRLLGPDATMLPAAKPVVAVCAVRTGCGKSQTARHLARHFRARGLRVAALRHPMPYGDLARQAVQRFATHADLDAADCTIEEREEYEPHIEAGVVVYAGVDYGAILAAAEEDADILLWDGGNNDFALVRPDVTVTLVDALRPGHLTTHHPGETTLRLADILVVNKVHAADPATVERLIEDLGRLAPGKPIVRAASPVWLDNEDAVRGRRVAIVEDGPTITHGGMPFGAGHLAVTRLGDCEIVDPRAHAHPEIARVYERYPHIGPVLPAMGYGANQIAALAKTLRAVPADVVVVATPIDLAALIDCGKQVVRARYGYEDAGEPKLTDLVDTALAKRRG
jgi:predicted GTPase